MTSIKTLNQRVADLEELVVKHQKLYDAGTPKLSDAEFDELVVSLRVLDPQNRVLRHLGAPVSNEKLKHSPKMLSLDKCYHDHDLESWRDMMLRTTADVRFTLQPKYDGVSVSLMYSGGRFVAAALRGDGEEGDVITDRVRDFVPAHLPAGALFGSTHRGPLVVRGEVVINKSDFRKLPAGEFANPRNMVAGILNRKTAKGKHALRFIAFDVYAIGTHGGELSYAVYPSTALEKLRTYGFIPASTKIVNGVDLIDARSSFASSLLSTDVGPEYDGIVIKVDSAITRVALGETSHHPLWAIAYKFQGESGKTFLRHVEWQVSRRGTVTPVAIVEPVELSGVVVQRSTLHNLDQMEALDLHLDDEVLMTRRGGVIPHVESVTKKAKRRIPIEVPTKCPSCASKLRREGGFLYCTKQSSCRSVRVAQITHYARTMDYDGFGAEVVGALYDAGLVRTPVDLYRPNGPIDATVMWENAVGVGVARNLAKQVLGNTRYFAIDQFLAALGFDGLGHTIGRKILKAFGTVEVALEADVADFQELPGVGLGRATSIVKDLRENRDMIEALLEKVRLMPATEAPVGAVAGPFTGESVVFTGKLTDMEREAARALVRDHGGETPSSVTSSTTMLVIGDQAKEEQRTKREKAEKLIAKGVKLRIITETEFIDMVAVALKSN